MHEGLILVYFVFFRLPIAEGISYEQNCLSTDCSQKFPVPFKCIVKGEAGWKSFKQKIKESNDNNDNFGAPILTSVDWYLKSYSNGLNPSLNVSFTVPDDSIKGVLLEFSSPGDLRVQDAYYHDHRKYRLFEINTESVPLHKPISIFYDCMTGLDENDFRVYEVTLQSLPGARTTYYVTTYYQGRSAVWRPAIATSSHTGGIIYVVFEKAGPEMNVSQYSVALMNFDDKTLVQSHQLRHPDLKTSHTFLPVKPGKYYIQISVYSPKCPNTICTATSWNVTIPPIDGQSVLLDNHEVLPKIMITLASVVGLFIIVFSMICYILQTRQKRPVCCCMSGTSSRAKMDQVNNLRELNPINLINERTEETILVEVTDGKIIDKYDEVHESELEPSDKSSGLNKNTTENVEKLKPSFEPDIPETTKDVHDEDNSLIADDTEVIEITDTNFLNQLSYAADIDIEEPSRPLLEDQRLTDQTTPSCPVHSRLRTFAPSNTCPLHGSAVNQKYMELPPNNGMAQLPVHATGEQSYSPAHGRSNLEYERLEQELMRINSLCDVSEV